MTFMKWDKRVSNREAKGKVPSIQGNGIIYLPIAITNELFPKSKFVEVFFDAGTSLLGLRPATNDGDGANYRITRWEKGKRGVHISLLAALRRMNILFPQKRIPHRIENGMLVLEVKRSND